MPNNTRKQNKNPAEQDADVEKQSTESQKQVYDNVIKRLIEDDVLKYYAGDNENLIDELLCFKVLLNRARPLPEAEMEQVLRRIRMYDPLLEEDPWVQEYGGKREAKGEARGEARGKAEGIAEGEAKGKAEGMRQNIEMIVQIRFPDLRESVMERVQQTKDPIALQAILVALGLTPNDLQARNYLQDL